MNMRKTTALILCIFLIGGCSKDSTSAVSSEKKESIVINEDSGMSGENSLHPSDVTDFDRAAITSLINMNMKERFGKNGYATIYADNIEFEKEDGILTAKGNYICYENGYEVLGFVYTYADEATYYSLLTADVGKEATDGENASESSAAFGKEPDRSYDVTITHSLTVTFTHDGEGTCRIVLVGEDGKEAAEVINQSGTIDIVKTVTVPSGNYKLQLYCTNGGWSMQFSTSES